jgi:hypothetical protein
MPNGENNRGVDFFTELERRANSIKAAAQAIDAVAATLEESATRSVMLEVNNTTTCTLKLQGVGDHDWGDFRKTPEFEIGPGRTDLFSSQSNGLLTGTEGNVQYIIEDGLGTIFHLEWSVPFLGDNSSHCRVEGGSEGFYVARAINGGGNTRVEMRFMVGEKIASARTDRNWKTCGSCKSLFLALDEGHCAARPLGIVSAPSDDMIDQMQSTPAVVPAPSRDMLDLIQVPSGGGTGSGGVELRPSSEQRRLAQRQSTGEDTVVDPSTAGMARFGRHEPAGDFFQLPYNIDGPNRFGEWRKCGHCKGLFYNGHESKGVCAGRRFGHVAAPEDQNFHLAFGIQPGPTQQNNWRLCGKCFGLFFLPHNDDGVCPADGNHHADSESYVLDRVVS